MTEDQEYLFKLIVVMSFNSLMKPRIEGFGMDRMIEWSKRHPDQDRAQDYLNRLSAPVDDDAVVQAERKSRWHMERLEHQLGGSDGPWICGEMFTLADVCVAPIMDRIEYLGREKLWQGLPAVEAWMEQVRTRPSYLEALPPFEDRMWGPKMPLGSIVRGAQPDISSEISA